jgi:hypothetical protein
MHGVNAELKGHPNKTYRDVFYCGCPGTEMHGTFIKKLTHKKERHETRQLLHILKQDIDGLGNHLDYQFANNEEAWTTRLDSC